MTANKRILGTDGGLGAANIEPVTVETALKPGRAVGPAFKRLQTEARGRVRHRFIIGKDTAILDPWNQQTCEAIRRQVGA